MMSFTTRRLATSSSRNATATWCGPEPGSSFRTESTRPLARSGSPPVSSGGKVSWISLPILTASCVERPQPRNES